MLIIYCLCLRKKFNQLEFLHTLFATYTYHAVIQFNLWKERRNLLLLLHLFTLSGLCREKCCADVNVLLCIMYQIIYSSNTSKYISKSNITYKTIQTPWTRCNFPFVFLNVFFFSYIQTDIGTNICENNKGRENKLICT
jgi:hypothetical protein